MNGIIDSKIEHLSTKKLFANSLFVFYYFFYLQKKIINIMVALKQCDYVRH